MAIEIGNYHKEVIRREPGKKEVSIIDWKSDDPHRAARTPAHDHSVAETTYVLEANPHIYQIVNGRKKYYRQGEKLLIPPGFVHEVGVDAEDGPAKTLNICEGTLSMNTFPSSDIE